MRTFRFSLLVAVPATIALAISPATAAGTWFSAAVESSINNGAGPGPAPRGTATADFNSDGRPDLASVGDFAQGDVIVTFNRGSNTFGGEVRVSGTTNTQGLDAGDLNGDGNADIVAASTSDAKIRFGNGAGGFSDGGSYPLTLGGQVEPLIVDVNGDGEKDILAPTFTAVQTLINNGNGTFKVGPRSEVAGAGAIAAASIAKLNSDTATDLFVTDGASGTTFALRGTGDGRFTVSGQLYAAGFVPEDVTAIDLDGDGFDDAATVGSFSFSVATGLTNGSGAFRSTIPASVTYGGPGPTSASAADFDGDGRQDLVVSSLANPTQGTMTVLQGNGTAKLTENGTYATAAFPQNPVLADYDGDGDVDIAAVSGGTVSVLPNITP